MEAPLIRKDLQKDFDERDLRLMGQALRLYTRRNAEGGSVAALMTDEELLAAMCVYAGISIERGRVLQAKQLDTDGKKPMGVAAG